MRCDLEPLLPSGVELDAVRKPRGKRARLRGWQARSPFGMATSPSDGAIFIGKKRADVMPESWKGFRTAGSRRVVVFNQSRDGWHAGCCSERLRFGPGRQNNQLPAWFFFFSGLKRSSSWLCPNLVVRVMLARCRVSTTKSGAPSA